MVIQYAYYAGGDMSGQGKRRGGLIRLLSRSKSLALLPDHVRIFVSPYRITFLTCS